MTYCCHLLFICHCTKEVIFKLAILLTHSGTCRPWDKKTICYPLLDPVVNRVERNAWLFCRSTYRLVDEFTTRLDLADFRSTWSTCSHVDHSFLLVLAHWQLTRKIVSLSTSGLPSSKWKAQLSFSPSTP